MLAATLFLSALAAAAPHAAPPDAAALIGRAADLVATESGKAADEVRALDRRLEALEPEAKRLGYAGAEPLGAAALDKERPLKLRLWLIAYLEALHDAAAFPALKRVLLDPAQPDLLRDAAARALLTNPVGQPTLSKTFCAALRAEPGPLARLAALTYLSDHGCADPRTLEESAALGGARPKGHEAVFAERALAALQRSPSPAALDSLDRLFVKYARETPQRARVLAALTARLPQLRDDPGRWAPRAREMLAEATHCPDSAVAGLALVAGFREPGSEELAERFLADRDPRVVVAAAEALATLGAKSRSPAVRRVYDGFYTDDRFANGPGADPVGWYDRLGASLKSLE